MDKEGLSQGAQTELVNLLEREVTNCMLVPVTRPDNGQLFFIVALINKQNGIIFDVVDHQAVKQCFQ